MEKSNFQKMSDKLHKDLDNLKVSVFKSIRNMIRTFGVEYGFNYNLIMSYKGRTLKNNESVYGGSLSYDKMTGEVTIEELVDGFVNAEINIMELDVEFLLAVYDMLVETYED